MHLAGAVIVIADYDGGQIASMIVRIAIALATGYFAWWQVKRFQKKPVTGPKEHKPPPVTDTPEEIARLAEQYLSPHQPSDFRLVVPRETVRQQANGWWHVGVKADWDGVPTSKFADRVMEAEMDLREATKKKVLLKTRR